MEQARTIDLNCDLGEIPRLIEDGTDEALMACVSSANVACGGHAGDAASIEKTVRAALRHGLAIGAHPSYPDREQFGRREMAASPRISKRSCASRYWRWGQWRHVWARGWRT